MKNKIWNQKKYDLRKICVSLAGALLLVGNSNICICANAAESTGCEIYHQHLGDTSTEGGCYKEPVYHVHSGNDVDGGSCYETPVYHTHQGDADSGGGCYGKTIYHQHSGNASSGGACYSAVKHSHSSSCNVSRECKITHEAVSVFRTWDAYCYHHQETVQGEANVIAHHSSCGKGSVETTISYCLTCGPYADSHTFQVVGCGINTNTITGYKLSCGKDESTPVGYETDCGRTETDIDAYGLSCEKTSDFIEGYRLGCGMEEGVAVARLDLTNETVGMQQTVTLSAAITDFTDGKAPVGSGSFIWYDGNGNVIGRQASVTVGQNGSYRVEFVPDGGSAGLSGLSHSIQVNNVVVPTPTPALTPVPVQSPVSVQTPAESDENTGVTDKQETVPENKTNSGQETAPANKAEGENRKEKLIPSASPSSSPTVTPTTLSHASALLSDGIKEGVAAVIGGLWEKGEEQDAMVRTPTPTEVPSPAMLSPELISGEDDADKNMTTGQQPEVLGEERKEEAAWIYEFRIFMKKPAVKIFTLTSGTLIGAGLLGIMLFFLRRTVKVYNDDGNGDMIYLGRCIIADEGDNFSITITGEMEEKAYTNRYCIKPGIFRLGRGEDRELIVCKDQKRVSVYLSKEMIVVI